VADMPPPLPLDIAIRNNRHAVECAFNDADESDTPAVVLRPAIEIKHLLDAVVALLSDREALRYQVETLQKNAAEGHEHKFEVHEFAAIGAQLFCGDCGEVRQVAVPERAMS
jgi:hypothetical protein